MGNVPFVSPTSRATAFNCPRCGAYAKQLWDSPLVDFGSGHRVLSDVEISKCTHCDSTMLWRSKELVDPSPSIAPPCHPDMPNGIKVDYEEASRIISVSPRASAALLRLAVQKLCRELGESGENINGDIAKLVEKGLPDEIQQSLDIVRVIGNEQVHPGQIDVRDSPDIAAQLFELVNFITEDRISRPKRIKSLYERLPESKLRSIEQRDAKKAAPIPSGRIDK